MKNEKKDPLVVRHIRFRESQWEALDKQATREDRDKSRLVRKALDEYLERERDQKKR